MTFHAVSRGTCSRSGCEAKARPGQRYCRGCHAAAQRDYRRRHEAICKALLDERYAKLVRDLQETRGA